MEFDDDLIRFYNARDLFLAVGNYSRREHDIKGLHQLRELSHPEALWMTRILEDCESFEQIITCLESYSDDATCILYLGCLTRNWMLVNDAAEVGHPLACSLVRPEEAKYAADQGDRMALRRTGRMYEAAKLGDWEAIRNYNADNAKTDPTVWHLRSNLPQWEFEAMVNYVELRYDPYSSVLYTIGGICKRKGYDKNVLIIRIYDRFNRLAREATLCWMAVAKRLGLYRDVARLIGGMVWNQREKWI